MLKNLPEIVESYGNVFALSSGITIAIWHLDGSLDAQYSSASTSSGGIEHHHLFTTCLEHGVSNIAFMGIRSTIDPKDPLSQRLDAENAIKNGVTRKYIEFSKEWVERIYTSVNPPSRHDFVMWAVLGYNEDKTFAEYVSQAESMTSQIASDFTIYRSDARLYENIFDHAFTHGLHLRPIASEDRYPTDSSTRANLTNLGITNSPVDNVPFIDDTAMESPIVYKTQDEEPLWKTVRYLLFFPLAMLVLWAVIPSLPFFGWVLTCAPSYLGVLFLTMWKYSNSYLENIVRGVKNTSAAGDAYQSSLVCTATPSHAITHRLNLDFFQLAGFSDVATVMGDMEAIDLDWTCLISLYDKDNGLLHDELRSALELVKGETSEATDDTDASPGHTPLSPAKRKERLEHFMRFIIPSESDGANVSIAEQFVTDYVIKYQMIVHIGQSSPEFLQAAQSQVINRFAKNNYELRPMNNQLDWWATRIPGCVQPPQLHHGEYHFAMASSLSSLVPMKRTPTGDECGIPIGFSAESDTNAPVMIDIFGKPSKSLPATTVIVGQTGSGKSTFMKNLMIETDAQDYRQDHLVFNSRNENYSFVTSALDATASKISLKNAEYSLDFLRLGHHSHLSRDIITEAIVDLWTRIADWSISSPELGALRELLSFTFTDAHGNPQRVSSHSMLLSIAGHHDNSHRRGYHDLYVTLSSFKSVPVIRDLLFNDSLPLPPIAVADAPARPKINFYDFSGFDFDTLQDANLNTVATQRIGLALVLYVMSTIVNPLAKDSRLPQALFVDAGERTSTATAIQSLLKLVDTDGRQDNRVMVISAQNYTDIAPVVTQADTFIMLNRSNRSDNEQLLIDKDYPVPDREAVLFRASNLRHQSSDPHREEKTTDFRYALVYSRGIIFHVRIPNIAPRYQNSASSRPGEKTYATPA